MTGPLFHSTNDGSVGWSTKDCFLDDATLSLVNEDGSLSNTGVWLFFFFDEDAHGPFQKVN